MPDFSLETALGGTDIAGVDEAGRGPWAGPVVAAAVMLGETIPEGLNDSKKLTALRRAALVAPLRAHARVGVGVASVAEIDRLNILAATMLAMERAVAALPDPPRAILIDGNRAPQGLPAPAHTVVKGDARALSIAAASVIAKVTRDKIMCDLDDAFPDYGWARNKGYGTAEHRACLLRHGVTPHHRRSFKPIHNILYQENLIKP